MEKTAYAAICMVSESRIPAAFFASVAVSILTEKKTAEILPVRPQTAAAAEFGSARKEEGNLAFNI